MRIELTNRAQKQLDKIDNPTALRLTSRMEKLCRNPYPRGVKKISHKDYFRLRSGDYRILYSINKKKQTITVARIAHRRELYRW